MGNSRNTHKNTNKTNTNTMKTTKPKTLNKKINTNNTEKEFNKPLPILLSINI